MLEISIPYFSFNMKISRLAIFFPFWFQVKREELLQFAQNAITGLKINVHLARLSSRSSYFLFYLVSSCFIFLSLFSAFWFGLPTTAFLQLLPMFHCIFVEDDGICI
jgi:hypothetical protein